MSPYARRRKSRQLHRAGPLALAAALLAGGTASCDRGGHAGSDDETSSTATAPSEPGHGEHPAIVKLSREAVEENKITVSPVGKRALVPLLDAPARVAFNSEAQARVGAPVAGRVGELKVRLGDTVHRGDALLVIESPDLGEAQSDYLQKGTALSAARAAVEPLRESMERGQSLYNQGQGVSLAELQKRVADYKAARAVVTGAEGAFKAAGNRLYLMGMTKQAVEELTTTGTLTPRYSVCTPIDGQVVRRDVTLGALVAPDRELAVEIADLSKLWVLADVPESRYGELKVGARASVTLPSLPGQNFDGEVAYVASSFEPGTRSVQARVEVKNEHGGMRPGMFARCRIETPAPGAYPVLAVPDEAVQEVEGKQIVFVPVAGDAPTFEAREVKAGAPVGGWVAVTSGLDVGDSVVTHGAFILKAQLAKPAEE